MKNLTYTSIFLAILLFISCLSEPKKKINKQDTQRKFQVLDSEVNDDFEFLKRLNGSSSGQILNNDYIEKRLRRILKNIDYTFLKNNWTVNMPIKEKNGTYVAQGCQQHNCNLTNFIIVLNIHSNTIYVGIREDGIVELFPKSDYYPEQILYWEIKN